MNKVKFIFKSFIDTCLYFYYKLLFFISRKKISDVWLISERGIDARDNGYWFYKYMIENHPEIKVKYVISKDSSDYSKINKEDVIEYRSKEHYYYFLYSKYLISAEIMGFSPNEQLYYRLCGAIPEQKYMIEKYGYSDKEAVLTGFSRFDQLNNLNEKIILIMPTWRKWLKYLDNLNDTEFYKKYMEILNDDEIAKKLEEKGYKIIFYPHIVLQKFLNNFNVSSSNIILAPFKDYDVQDLLKRSSLLVTDYSSVAFDYAYMMKKVIYYQFDLEKYRNEQYADGYYDYLTDGFGPVIYDFNLLKEQIINFLDNSEFLDEYDYRIEKFFDKHDKKNSERIYNAIIDLDRK